MLKRLSDVMPERSGFLVLINGVIPIIAGNRYLSLGILAVSTILIVVFAPANHPSLGLDEKEIEKCRKASRRLLLLYMTCIGIAVWIDLDATYVACAIAGIGFKKHQVFRIRKNICLE